MRDVAFDTETWLIQPGRLAPPLVCLTWHDGVSGGILLRDAGLDWLQAQLTDGDVRLVGANVAYDCGVAAQARPALLPQIFCAYEAGRIVDVQIFEHLRKLRKGWLDRDPRTGKPPAFALDALVAEYLAEHVEGKHGADVWRYRYHELDGVPLAAWPAEAREYALEDARYTYRVWQAQQNKQSSPDLVRQCCHAFWLHLASAWGLRTDPAAVSALAEDLQGQVEGTFDRLEPLGLIKRAKTGGRSKDMAAIKARIERALGGKTPRTATGAVSTSEETLRVAEDEALTLLADAAGAGKLVSTYLPVLERGASAPINPRYDVLKASGRTSSWDPNVQNLPRHGGVRTCFVPRAGRIYIDADYHIAELCGLAQVLCDLYGAQSSAMAAALREGKELHLLLAGEILGLDYAETERRYRAKDPEVKEARQLAKAGNFGFPGGLGARNFVRFAKATYGVILCSGGSQAQQQHNQERDDEGLCVACIEAGKHLKERWLTRFPEMRDYFRDMGRLVERAGGGAEIEQLRSLRVRGGVGYCDGCNTYFQGIVADGAKAAGWLIAKEAYADPTSPLYRAQARTVAFVHDEFLLEAIDDLHLGADSVCRAAAARVSALMVQGMQVFCPDVPIRADAHLMRRWYKDAEPVYVDGLLMPWEPKK